MMEPGTFVTDFYVIHYEALFPHQRGYRKRKPLAGVVAMPHGEGCPPNAVAGPFLTRQEAECARQEKRGDFLGH